MPNALILGYQKSRIRHTPSHLRPPERATGSFVIVGVFNTGVLTLQPLRCERMIHQARQAVMGRGFDENLGNKARVVQGSLLLTTFARVCGEFCSETSPIAAAHGARTLIFERPKKNKQSHIQNTTWAQNPSATLSLLNPQGVLHGKEVRTS
jgi:filamentous hemagglutinin family protein